MRKRVKAGDATQEELDELLRELRQKEEKNKTLIGGKLSVSERKMIDADDIGDVTLHEYIKKQANDDLAEDEVFALKRNFFKKCWGVDNIDEVFVKTYNSFNAHILRSMKDLFLMTYYPEQVKCDSDADKPTKRDEKLDLMKTVLDVVGVSIGGGVISAEERSVRYQKLHKALMKNGGELLKRIKKAYGVRHKFDKTEVKEATYHGFVNALLKSYGMKLERRESGDRNYSYVIASLKDFRVLLFNKYREFSFTRHHFFAGCQERMEEMHGLNMLWFGLPDAGDDQDEADTEVVSFIASGIFLTTFQNTMCYAPPQLSLSTPLNCISSIITSVFYSTNPFCSFTSTVLANFGLFAIPIFFIYFNILLHPVLRMKICFKNYVAGPAETSHPMHQYVPDDAPLEDREDLLELVTRDVLYPPFFPTTNCPSTNDQDTKSDLKEPYWARGQDQISHSPEQSGLRGNCPHCVIMRRHFSARP
uniref:Uncharacterized protein n=1 Tax=Percolomonas cosmopolitus TaxID=63605 RepID=A0A7S1KM19_9EUKA|mmetsp:Transcript_11018/g.41036  ORF Transcript_11018/g.41036 Transcript_11018/m.41036 type:complete len:476 (+) Transcript_11018:2457-3884(+)